MGGLEQTALLFCLSDRCIFIDESSKDGEIAFVKINQNKYQNQYRLTKSYYQNNCKKRHFGITPCV